MPSTFEGSAFLGGQPGHCPSAGGRVEEFLLPAGRLVGLAPDPRPLPTPAVPADRLSFGKAGRSDQKPCAYDHGGRGPHPIG